MGDRANVRVREDEKDNGVFLYTHWDASRLPATVLEALKREERWDDPAYLTRIIFCHMVRGSEADSTGYGISTRLCDNSYSIISLNCDTQIIRLENEDGTEIPESEKTFAQFIQMTPEGVTKWRNRDYKRNH